jgi:DNA primase
LGETAAKFRLGFAPPGWDGLTSAAAESGYGEDELVEAGLVIRKEARGEPSRGPGIRRRGVYDRFRERIIFPIADAQGRVIAFGARAMGDAEPKYLNSPETPLYTKGRHLYALHLAKDAMLKTGDGAVMEGYTDVMMSHQAGWPVAVAGLGTALTPEQARRVSRYVRRLWLVYDGDEAGLRAAERAVPAFLSQAVEARVVVLPPGRDPFDLMRSGGLDAMQPYLRQSLESFDHLLRERGRARDRTTAAGRAAATEDALRALVGVEDPVRRALYLRRLADEYGVPEDVAREQLRALAHRASRRDSPHGEAPTGAVSETAPPPPAAERLLLEALVGRPELLDELGVDGSGIVSDALCRDLLECLVAARGSVAVDSGGDSGGVAARSLLDRIAEPRLAAFAADLSATGFGKDLLVQGRDCLARLRGQREAREIQEELRRAPESDEWLRKLVSHHRRRARGAGE